MTLGPVPAGLLGFLGSWDQRLVRGEISWTRAFFNRGQIALACFAGALVFHTLGGNIDHWPSAILPCLAAVAIDVVINISLVSPVVVRTCQVPFASVAKAVVLDSPFPFVITYLGLAPLALLMATAVRLYGVVGLAAGVVPLLMARQVFALLNKASVARREAKAKQAMLEELQERIESERRDERARIAMDLHDGALAALFRVDLMGEVLRQDLVSGRLLELENDVPELRQATAVAADTLRSVIRGLRTSSIGAQGVCKTLDLLVEELSTRSRALFHTDIVPTAPDPATQLVVYQVAREALENAVRHSGAQNISLSLRPEGEWIRLIVRDDGAGFVRSQVDSTAHFGLDMMEQRVNQMGGFVHVASEPGWGTQVVARLHLKASRGNETS
jgi:signal transduction histidine kinase